METVLLYRREALYEHRWGDETILPYRAHSVAWRRFKGWFEESDLAKRALESCG